MAICNLTWYQPQVRKIMKSVRCLKKKDIGSIQNISRQAVSKGMSSGLYEKRLTEIIQILDLAGWEIREKE